MVMVGLGVSARRNMVHEGGVADASTRHERYRPLPQHSSRHERGPDGWEDSGLLTKHRLKSQALVYYSFAE
jgi:hypothetical protein